MSYNYDSIDYATYLLKHEAKQNKGAKGRDSERTRTYQAEWMFQRQINDVNFADIAEAEKFAKKIYKSKTWSKLWKESINDNVAKIFDSNPRIVAMSNRNKKNSGFTNGRVVTLAQAGLNRYTLLHELAHCLGHMHHGRSFRQCLLKLVGVFMGADEKAILKNEFKRKGLASGNARKALSFDKWIAARDRMEDLRTKRQIEKEKADRARWDAIIQPCE
jgi:predicted metal-dependent hydrolase